MYNYLLLLLCIMPCLSPSHIFSVACALQLPSRGKIGRAGSCKGHLRLCFPSIPARFSRIWHHRVESNVHLHFSGLNLQFTSGFIQVRSGGRLNAAITGSLGVILLILLVIEHIISNPQVLCHIHFTLTFAPAGKH